MKNQALFSSKDKSKKLKCLLLQFLFVTLRFKNRPICTGSEYIELGSFLPMAIALITKFHMSLKL